MNVFRSLLPFAALCVTLAAHAQQKFITMASTTSTVQSGVLKHLLPAFEKKTGIQVYVVALGTGQALDLARRGNADVVFVHAKALEEKFVADGFGLKRVPVMYNDFVLIGPKADPAKVAGGKDIVLALRAIRSARAPFVSRGDRSGTHIFEIDLWKLANLDIAKERGQWYRDTGQSMASALNSAATIDGYILADRASWISFGYRRNLTVVVEGDRRLFNQYSVILVNPAKHAHVKRELGQTFVDWIVSAEGQREIAGYKIGEQQLFFPDASPDKG